MPENYRSYLSSCLGASVTLHLRAPNFCEIILSHRVAIDDGPRPLLTPGTLHLCFIMPLPFLLFLPPSLVTSVILKQKRCTLLSLRPSLSLCLRFHIPLCVRPYLTHLSKLRLTELLSIHPFVFLTLCPSHLLSIHISVPLFQRPWGPLCIRPVDHLFIHSFVTQSLKVLPRFVRPARCAQN